MPRAKYKYVEGSPTKICSKCDTEKPLIDFPKNKSCSAGVASTCKACQNLAQESWRRKAYAERPDFRERRQASQDKQRAKQYGLTETELADMIASSKGLCEICKEPPSGNGTSGKVLHVDHCHGSGNVRGMLCSRCNLILGGVEDNEDILLGMVAYLRKHKENHATLRCSIS